MITVIVIIIIVMYIFVNIYLLHMLVRHKLVLNINRGNKRTGKRNEAHYTALLLDDCRHLYDEYCPAKSYESSRNYPKRKCITTKPWAHLWDCVVDVTSKHQFSRETILVLILLIHRDLVWIAGYGIHIDMHGI